MVVLGGFFPHEIVAIESEFQIIDKTCKFSYVPKHLNFKCALWKGMYSLRGEEMIQFKCSVKREWI